MLSDVTEMNREKKNGVLICAGRGSKKRLEYPGKCSNDDGSTLKRNVCRLQTPILVRLSLYWATSNLHGPKAASCRVMLGRAAQLGNTTMEMATFQHVLVDCR
jgi:hypothetical protein